MGKQGLITHILAPIDGSETSMLAGRFTIQLALIHEARVTFLYVVDTAVVEEIAGAISRTPESIHQDLENKGKSYMDYFTHLAEEKNLHAQQIIRQGIPHSEIPNAARELGVDMIVIGRVGSHGPRSVAIGRVAERVIERAHCPVLVVSHIPTHR